MRKFAIVVFNDKFEIINTYRLDKVTLPSGLGFTQKLDVITTKTIDYIADRCLEKKDIKLTVIFEEPLSYTKMNLFRDWYCSHIGERMALQYNDGHIERYVDMEVKEFQVSEIDTGINTVPMVIQPLSPFYVRKARKLLATVGAPGKSYPFSYPYSYGGAIITNNVFENTFFNPIPLRVIITGKFVNPEINLKDANDEIYATVAFDDLTIEAGETLIVDAINTQIIFISSGGEIADYYNYVDKTQHTFLYAQPGVTSVVANINPSYPTAGVSVEYVQYIM